jgi:hypothetical protein
MAISPKKIQEIREQRAQIKANRKERLDLEATNTEALNNAVTEDSKPQGQQKLGSLILKQGQKLSKFVVPLALNLLREYAVDQAKQEVEAQEISPEELREKFCPSNLQDIIQKRNDAVEYLNNTGARLDSLSITVDFGANFASLLQGLVSTVKRGQTLANIAMSFIPFALPGAVPAAINQAGTIADSVLFNADGTPRIPPIKITASQVSPAVASVQSTILKCVDLLGRLDILINLCDPNSTLVPLSDSINDIIINESLAEASQNDTTYKGFILEIETKPYTDRVNQNRAVGKNKSGIVLIATDYSFASDPQVLITELKFIIDRDDLKAY